MQFSKEEILQPQSIPAAKSERISTRWLVLSAGKSPFFHASSYADNLQESLTKRHKRAIRVESSNIIADSITSIRKLVRLIPQFDSIQLMYDGTVSFSKSILPAAVIARFFGKRAALLYNPDQIVDEIPRWHRRAMLLCSNVYVGTRYLKRELAKQNVKSEVMLPPVSTSALPARTIREIQPHILLVNNSAVDSGAICAMRAFIMVKHKYPRTTMTVVTDEPVRWLMGVMQLGQNIQGHDYVSPHKEQDVKKIFGEADLFVNCSASEAAPSALLAAMATGMPSISFETYGAREIIENGINGLLIRHNDHNQLAEEIIRLIEEPALAPQMSKEAAKLRAKVTVENIVRYLQ